MTFYIVSAFVVLLKQNLSAYSSCQKGAITDGVLL